MNLNDLKTPFDPSEVEFRAGATNEEKTRALALAYIDARLVADRLDSVCGPENWQDEYKPGPAGGVLCRLSIRVDGEWVAKEDVGENTDYEAVKGGISDAFKRAAVKWGIGRYLYGLPGVWVKAEVRGKSVKIDEADARALTFGGQRPAPSQPAPRSNGSSQATQPKANGKPAQGDSPAKSGNGKPRNFRTLDGLVAQLCKDLELVEAVALSELKAAGYNTFKESESGKMYQAVADRIKAQESRR
jgi:hypothetical protein